MSETLQDSEQKVLRDIVDRYERLAEEKAAIASDQKDILLEAKSRGLDPKYVRKAIALRKKSKEEREQEEAMLASYMAALGDLADTPLGKWAKPGARPELRAV
jgi:uncharacterized protein (UPF0335 family)